MTFLIAGLVLILIIFYIIYAGLIGKKNAVMESLSGIDVQLKKRHDLIPNILTLAQKFMDHEKSLLSEITELRAAVQKPLTEAQGAELQERFDLEAQLNAKMGKLFVNVENYPQLKSDQTILHAQETYNEVEEHIAASRRFYNSSVTILNNAVKIFPSSTVAGMLNIQEMPYFEASAEDKKEVNAADYLK
ncbi:MAG: LemA family protein [Patescibacteria group bacterium]